MAEVILLICDNSSIASEFVRKPALCLSGENIYSKSKELKKIAAGKYKFSIFILKLENVIFCLWLTNLIYFKHIHFPCPAVRVGTESIFMARINYIVSNKY